MRNIILSIDENELEVVQIYAAKRQTTVEALVRDYIRKLVRQQTQPREAIARLREMSEQSTAELGPGYKFNRDSLHDR
jgi:hypothetical protein